MRPETVDLLTRYASGRASLEAIRSLVYDADFSEGVLPEEERSLLLEAYAYICGIDEDLNDELDLKDRLRALLPLVA
jgi:hypothetical protein